MVNSGVTFDRVVRSSVWEKSWEGQLSLEVTDVSTTVAEIIVRIEWEIEGMNEGDDNRDVVSVSILFADTVA